MDTIGIILVIVGVLIILGTAIFSKSSDGATSDLARLMQRVPGGWLAGVVLIAIGLLLIAIPGGPPPDAGPPADAGPPGDAGPP